MQAGLKKAIEVPLDLMQVACSCWPHVATIAEYGNITAISDVQVMKGTDHARNPEAYMGLILMDGWVMNQLLDYVFHTLSSCWVGILYCTFDVSAESTVSL